jgi:hypothetical protein
MVSNSEKCDKAAASINREPQRTPLAATASTQSSISSVAEDNDVARENVPPGHSNTKSWTWAAVLHMASSLVSTSHHIPCLARSRLMTSSSRVASRTRLEEGPWTRSQTLMPNFLRHKHCSSCS